MGAASVTIRRVRAAGRGREKLYPDDRGEDPGVTDNALRFSGANTSEIAGLLASFAARLTRDRGAFASRCRHVLRSGRR